jgi:hypothetical protein
MLKTPKCNYNLVYSFTSENNSGTISEDESNSLILGNTLIHRINKQKVITFRHSVAFTGRGRRENLSLNVWGNDKVSQRLDDIGASF